MVIIIISLAIIIKKKENYGFHFGRISSSPPNGSDRKIRMKRKKKVLEKEQPTLFL